MGKSTTPSFVIKRRILTYSRDNDSFFETKFNLANRIYNNGVRHCIPLVQSLYEDVWYQHAYEMWKKASTAGDEDEAKSWRNEIYLCMQVYGLTEYNLQAYLNTGRIRSCPKGMMSDMVQKIAPALYQSIGKAVFCHTKIHYRKRGQTCSFEEKRNDTGIIYNKKDDTVSIFKRKFRLKKIRANDTYLQEAMKDLKVKYCRVVREPHGLHYRYYLQITAEGVPPQKIKPGEGFCGIDEGVSTVAYANNAETGFQTLAEGVEKYDKALRRVSAKYERRIRAANPQCFNPDGTWKRGARITNHTAGMHEAVMELKGLYKKKSNFVKHSHGYMTNRILEGCSTIVKEPMNYKALQKRSTAKAERSDKTSVIQKKDGTVQTIRKFKRKKRFGTSINRRSPGLFNQMLEEKSARLGITVINVDLKRYRASQLDHSTGEYKKLGLSDRTKKVDGHLVQRDLYSAWLLYSYQDDTKPDLWFCARDFKRFLGKQGRTVKDILKKGDTTGNFGLKDFLKAA